MEAGSSSVNISAPAGAPSPEEQSGYYDRLWKERPVRLNSHELRRLSKITWAVAWLTERLGDKPWSILELGCGSGWLASELSKYGSVSAVDLSAEGIRLAKERWPHIDFRVGDATRYQEDKRFDLIVSSEVIEHIEDQKAFFGTIKNAVKPGGFCIVTCPNARARAYHKGLEQPIENWPAPDRLRKLAGEADLTVTAHETFLTSFSHEGVYKIINSYRLRQALGIRGAGALDALFCSMGFGLYQIMVARNDQG